MLLEDVEDAAEAGVEARNRSRGDGALARRLLTECASEEASVTTSDPAAPILEKQPAEVRELIQQLRAFIREVMPQVSEKVHMGWGTILYGAGGNMRDLIVALAPHRAYVNLEFGDGVELPDPARRLQGTGKRLRHVKIRSIGDVRHPDVRRLLEAAARRRGL